MSGNAVRTVFMGTPAFAVPSLEALLELRETDDRGLEVIAVYTQPDRPAGRGNKLSPSPVKERALAAGIPVEQPERLRRPEAFARLADLAPDLIVVAAYAQILSPKVLALPRFGCLNVHASLLPNYRGAAPIQAAILSGDHETGVCVMQMEAGLDTGPILTCYREPIHAADTAGTLSERLSRGGAQLLKSTVPRWLRGEIEPQVQDDSKATLTRMLRKEDGNLDWSLPVLQLERQVRAMQPWPGAYSQAGALTFKVLEASALESTQPDAAPGTLLAGEPMPRVVTGQGMLGLRIVQPAGKRPMSAADWLRGAQGVAGSQLGSPS